MRTTDDCGSGSEVGCGCRLIAGSEALPHRPVWTVAALVRFDLAVLFFSPQHSCRAAILPSEGLTAGPVKEKRNKVGGTQTTKKKDKEEKEKEKKK